MSDFQHSMSNTPTTNCPIPPYNIFICFLQKYSFSSGKIFQFNHARSQHALLMEGHCLEAGKPNTARPQNPPEEQEATSTHCTDLWLQ